MSNTHLVKVRLQKMHSRLLLHQARPVLGGQLRLLQHHLDIARGVVNLAGGGVDLGVEVEVDVVIGLLRLAVAREIDVSGLDVELDFLGVDVWDGDGEEDVVLFRFA